MTEAPARAATRPAAWIIAPEAYDSAVAAALWRAYYTEVSDRWYLLHEGRTTDPDELEREIAAESGADLAPPHGVLLVARYGDEPGGTAGVRLLDPATAELKRVFVREDLRGKGGAPVLLAAAEDAARALGAERLVLDTRTDLVEARALYTRHGYEEIEPYAESAYAEHWYGKRLAPAEA
ncbi:GNAT family N-acetyltransferase [Streptomyces alboniger]|uniref:GNAT family N-acetyltransferase n=1 Tax=Streptomyces alboniger TaxID=132473 RepID=A0A5J6HHF1_STRAD|nr:GNAT family N-acetyltransferase [Streptomyces alboniger]QEV17880.1 GNAT family N-acetyltransferase [Streptomyces alboniger]